MKISIIIPCFNEINTISEAIQRVEALDFGEGYTKEIIVVDDASTDGTREFLAGLTTEKHVTVFHAHNSGKGQALRSGIRVATGDIVMFQDADLELAPEEFEKLLRKFDDASVTAVYGSRFLERKEKTLNRNYILNKCLNVFFNILFMTGITDLETGHKAFRSKLIKGLNLKSDRFDIEVEITAKICKRGVSIVEVPIAYTPRDKSGGKKLSYMKDGFRAGLAILRYRFFN